MVQKIGISVSDELFEEVQKTKGAFKVSKVCQGALQEAVNFANLSNSQDIEALKKRIDNERKELFRPYLEEGYKDGINDAYSMSYGQLKSSRDFFGEDQDDSAPFEYYANKDYRDKYDSIETGELIFKCEGFLELSDDKEKLWALAATIYWSGWDDGVKSILEQLNLY